MSKDGIIYAIATFIQLEVSMKKETYEELYAELEKYENAGIRMKLNDYPASPLQIVSAHMIRENPSYMRDYVWDDKGKVKELTFYDMFEN